MKTSIKTTNILLLFLLLLPGLLAHAQTMKVDQSSNDINQLEAQLDRLSRISYHPNLLPVILRNRDMMGLTQEQIAAFRQWRNEHFADMVDTMNLILRKRMEFQEKSISRSVSNAELVALQEEIFQLHRNLLSLKLSCRDNIVKTFNEDNWDTFYMVLTGEGIGIPIPSFSAVTP